MVLSFNIKHLIGALISIMATPSVWAASCPDRARYHANLSAERFNGGLMVEAVRMRADARGHYGYSSFAADDQFQIEGTPLHKPESRFLIGFYASFNGSSVYQGNFNEVFVGRGSGDEDLASFYYSASGLWYRSIRWGGAWQKLANMTCEVGPRGQTVVQGRIINPGFGDDYWTFVISNMAEQIFN